MVRGTSGTVVSDVEIKHQRHRVRRVRQVDRQLNIPTIPTPAFSYVLWGYKPFLILLQQNKKRREPGGKSHCRLMIHRLSRENMEK